MSVTKILVVEDFLPWQQLVLEKFESEIDLKVISVAANGLEAVQQAKELQPDVILMDVGLPGVNGLEATRQIRIVSPGSKILFLSDHRSSDLVKAAFDAGGSGYVLKIDCCTDLITGIQTILRNEQFVSRSLIGWQESCS